MAFNSLDAQREACEAYIRSQKAEGWNLVQAAYDDGGWSGGTMDRPALRRLLDDVREGRVDVIVVYKVDRLTRSLADFAKIVEILDNAGASFVSVTQAFNTTNSMGRLTLNVLLSFAQFEREVIAERVRDKIAASKAKGMWMGGVIPLGYDVADRKLVPNQAEAATVRAIFERYLELPSVRALKEALDQEGILTKCANNRSGLRGGQPFSRGGLYHLLSNPVFIGKTRHHDKIYEGEHESILPLELWDAVQHKLKDQSASRAATGSGKAFLTGLVRDEHGRPMSPTHATKKIRRYYYYASNTASDMQDGKPETDCPPVVRVAQKAIHDAVRHAVTELFSKRSVLDLVAEHSNDMGTIQSAIVASGEIRTNIAVESHAALGGLLQRVGFRAVIGKDRADATIDRSALLRTLLGDEYDGHDGPDRLPISLPLVSTNRGKVRRLVLDGKANVKCDPDPRLVRLLVRGHLEWKLAFSSDGPPSNADRVRLARLATLAPDITTAILEGRQPSGLTSRDLLRIRDLPYDWDEQRQLLGFRQHRNEHIEPEPPAPGSRFSHGRRLATRSEVAAAHG